jgi:hypothetical protein
MKSGHRTSLIVTIILSALQVGMPLGLIALVGCSAGYLLDGGGAYGNSYSDQMELIQWGSAGFVFWVLGILATRMAVSRDAKGWLQEKIVVAAFIIMFLIFACGIAFLALLTIPLLFAAATTIWTWVCLAPVFLTAVFLQKLME